MAAEILQIDGEDVLFDGTNVSFGDPGFPYEETINHIYTQQLVQVVGSVPVTDSLVFAQQGLAVLSFHEFDLVLFTGQMITVVDQRTSVRRNFMNFKP